MNNPFVFGKVVQGKQFCNRKIELKELEKYISNQTSVWIYSPRRFGKTSLLVNTFSRVENVKTIYFDMFNIRNSEEFAEKYLTEICNELLNWKSGVKAALHQLSQFLKNISPTFSVDALGNSSIGIEKGKGAKPESIASILELPEKLKFRQPICIAFDEFQEIMRIDPFLINMMRSAFQHQQNVSYIFLGSKESLMESIFSDMKSPFYQFGLRMNLGLIPEWELVEYIRRMFAQTKLEISDTTIKGIMQISGNHPHYTQYVASIAWEMILEGNEQNEEFIEHCLNRILLSQSETFYFLYEQFNSNQRKVLYALSQEDKISIYSEDVRIRYELPNSSTLTTALSGLQKKSVIQKSNGSYYIENPIFKLWIKSIRR